MKKSFAALLILIAAVFLMSCGSNGYYDQGYADGRADGRLEAELELYDKRFESGYDAGWEDGYSVGYDSWFDHPVDPAKYFEDEAVQYAAKNSGWHPEEAWSIIEAYHNSDPFWEDGSPPSKQDYYDAIDSMIYFYEYFYSAKYN